MKSEDIALLAYIRTCAIKYPNMTVARCLQLAAAFANNQADSVLEIAPEHRRVPLGDRRFTENKPLTPRQIEALRIIIDLHTAQAGATRGSVAEAMGVAPETFISFTKPLIRGGYIEEIKKPNAKFKRPKCFYIPLKDEHGETLTKPETKSEGGVTKCPPAYAMGYGYDKHAFHYSNKRGGA